MSRMPSSPLSNTIASVKSSLGTTFNTDGYIFLSSLLKRLNLEWAFSLHNEVPICHQFFLVKLCPCQDQLLLLFGQIAISNFTHTNVHRRLILVVVGMKMWRIMLTRSKIHPNNYAAKHRERWHSLIS